MRHSLRPLNAWCFFFHFRASAIAARNHASGFSTASGKPLNRGNLEEMQKFKKVDLKRDFREADAG